MGKVADELKDAARHLSRTLAAQRFAAPVAYVYDPLDYAWEMHAQYLTRFADGRRRVVFLGMNPGPFGMAQTGVPFGEVAHVRDWMKLAAPIRAPRRTHPKRPVLGLSSTRSEVSGARLWGAIARAHPDPATFFRDHIVMNYCPLLFLDDGGRNLTPDKLPRAERTPLQRACDEHLARVCRALRPEVVVGVGAFARQRAAAVLDGALPSVRVVQIPHPSPASPQANTGWAALARRALRAADVVDAL